MEINSKNITIVAIIVLIILGFIWWQKSTPALPADNGLSTKSESGVKLATPPPGMPKTAPATTLSRTTKEGIYLINYLKSGFVPSALEIPIGKSVRFVNNSGKAMRISSADTTNNPIYNAFNQSKTVGQGGIYEYTFTDKGVFSYRNINNPGDQGAITVIK